MNVCKNCIHAIYDELWGEYKCKKKQITVREEILNVECPDREEKPKKKRR